MRTLILLCLLTMALSLGCSNTPDETSDVAQPTALAPPGSVCLGMTCTNPDGNTHLECGCGADYCVPNERTVEFAGLTPLTCIKGDCAPDDPGSCPENYDCLEIPTFAIEWLQTERGISMPPYLCVPEEVDTPMGPRPSAQDESWISIAGGTYLMGPTGGPNREVQLEPFQILKSEVTNGQYRYCVEQELCTQPGHGSGCTGAEQDTDLPINCVSWHQARALCQSLGGDLPSESQWEYAARSEGQLISPWGDEPATCDRVIMQLNGEDACGHGSAQPVCRLELGHSAQGLCDMVGNVWEWTLDDYQDDYARVPENGDPLVIEGSNQKVSRGGAYAYDEQYQNVFYRNDHGEADFQVPTYGFRCVRASSQD